MALSPMLTALPATESGGAYEFMGSTKGLVSNDRSIATILSILLPPEEPYYSSYHYHYIPLSVGPVGGSAAKYFLQNRGTMPEAKSKGGRRETGGYF